MTPDVTETCYWTWPEAESGRQGGASCLSLQRPARRPEPDRWEPDFRRRKAS